MSEQDAHARLPGILTGGGCVQSRKIPRRRHPRLGEERRGVCSHGHGIRCLCMCPAAKRAMQSGDSEAPPRAGHAGAHAALARQGGVEPDACRARAPAPRERFPPLPDRRLLHGQPLRPLACRVRRSEVPPPAGRVGWARGTWRQPHRVPARLGDAPLP